MHKEKPIYYDLSYQINGILFEAHNELGRFRNEKQYGDYIEERCKNKNIAYEREKVLPASFEGELRGRNKIDFLIDNKIILEIKAKRLLEKPDYYQTKRYLVALDKKLGLLINFREKFLKPRRILNSEAQE